MCHLATSFEKGLEHLTLHYAPNTPWQKKFVIWRGRAQNVWRRCTWYIPTLKTRSEKLSSQIFYPRKGYNTLEQFTTKHQKKLSLEGWALLKDVAALGGPFSNSNNPFNGWLLNGWLIMVFWLTWWLIEAWDEPFQNQKLLHQVLQSVPSDFSLRQIQMYLRALPSSPPPPNTRSLFFLPLLLMRSVFEASQTSL